MLELLLRLHVMATADDPVGLAPAEGELVPATEGAPPNAET